MISVLAPAKLNLFLHVVGRRPDGMHDLQTVFQFLDFGDELRIAPRGDGAIRRLEPVPDIPEAEDLSLRAAHALREATGCVRGCGIAIDKRIPVGGGLGGGSSDAASTLVALNRLWGLDLPLERLARIGLSLGADVPVFVHGHAAWAEGVGERLTPMELPEPWYLVVTPPCQVSTRELFAAQDLCRDAPRIAPADFERGCCGNAFEPVARARYPEIGEALDWLRREAGFTGLSGTGASVFAAFDTEAEARAAAARLPTEWRHIVARGCNRSPLRVA